jgi:hypothetical protein
MHRRILGLCCCLALVGVPSLDRQAAQPLPMSSAEGAASPLVSAAVAEYQRKLAEYSAAFQAFDRQAQAYWSLIGEKRQLRNAKRRAREAIVLDDYVLTQPPAYSGPPKPIDPTSPRPEPTPRKYIPVAADFLRHAAEQYQFAPDRPAREIDFKRVYAKAAVAAGLTKDQVVRIYGFEVGGNGTYEVQAGLEHSRNARAISEALGYNQLLHTNSVELLAEQGDDLVGALKKRAGDLNGTSKTALERKVAVLHRMIRFARTVPDSWSEHERIANTPEGLGIHALNFDIDTGPPLQVQKLLNSIHFARAKGFKGALTAAELEMMNFTGDGNGFDMVTMPQAMRDKVPTANFFQRRGYERNPVAIRNNVVAKLLAVTDQRMDQESKQQGARDLAAAFDAARQQVTRAPE